jgi:hypothetical protein
MADLHDHPTAYEVLHGLMASNMAENRTLGYESKELAATFRGYWDQMTEGIMPGKDGDSKAFLKFMREDFSGLLAAAVGRTIAENNYVVLAQLRGLMTPEEWARIKEAHDKPD